jgi:hypothetical protein
MPFFPYLLRATLQILISISLKELFNSHFIHTSYSSFNFETLFSFFFLPLRGDRFRHTNNNTYIQSAFQLYQVFQLCFIIPQFNNLPFYIDNCCFQILSYRRTILSKSFEKGVNSPNYF